MFIVRGVYFLLFCLIVLAVILILAILYWAFEPFFL